MNDVKDEPLTMTAASVAKLIGVSPKVLKYMSDRGDFPSAMRLGHRTVVYKRTAVRQWLADSKLVPATT